MFNCKYIIPKNLRKFRKYQFRPNDVLRTVEVVCAIWEEEGHQCAVHVRVAHAKLLKSKTQRRRAGLRTGDLSIPLLYNSKYFFI